MSEKLKALIEKVRNNTTIYSWSESKTKQGIIEPILRYLGWDTSDVEEVCLEYYIPDRRDKVDYSLRSNGEDKVFIEAKKVGDKLQDKTQLCDYANHKDVKLAVFTNGISWEFFLPREDGKWEQREFYTIHICQQDSDDIVSKFFAFLGKDNVTSGEAIKNAKMTHEGQKRSKDILKNLPIAWNKIICEPDVLLVELMKDTVEKLCGGYKPDDEQIKKFIREKNSSQPKPPPQGKIKCIKLSQPSKYGRKTLEQILMVIRHMASGKNYTTACKETAKSLGVEESTIRDKCTSRIGINTEEFINLVKEDTITNFLSQRFSDFNNEPIQ